MSVNVNENVNVNANMNGARGAGPPLRIGIDGRELEGKPTGVGRYLRSLLRRFANDGRHDFVIYSAGPVSLPTDSPRITSRVLPGGHPLVWEQTTLRAAIRGDGIDVLLSPAYSCPIGSGVPTVTALHDLSFFARPEEFSTAHGMRRRMMARLAARESRALLACSEFTRSEIARHLGASVAEKTRVVLLGPDDDLPKGPNRGDARKALGLSDGDLYVVTVGTVLRRRNVSVLIRALARVRERVPGVRLGIVGENRSHPVEDVEGLVTALGLQKAVRTTGFVTDDEVAVHYAAADAAVFLSEYEGFGLPALEAMSRGVPVMIANRGSLNEVFANASVVVEPDEVSVAGALAELLGDENARARMAARGVEHAKAFSWERTAAETLAVLEQAAS